MARKGPQSDWPDSAPLLSKMQELGFSPYEARIYVQLLRNSPATAYEVSKTTGVPRSNAYSTLDALTQKGIVQPISQEPIRYVALDPETVIDRIANRTRAICEDVVSHLRRSAKPEDTQFVWTIRGEHAVTHKIRKMIDSADRNIWIKAADGVLRQHRDELRRASKRGVDLLIVMFGSDPEEFRFSKNARVYLHEGNGVRMGTADNLFTVSVDHKEALTARIEGEVFAVYTQSEPIVIMAESLIRHEFYMAEIFLHLSKPVERKFGPHMHELRTACFTPEQLAAFREKMGLPET